MPTVSDQIVPGGVCEHPSTYRCRESCECLCPPCWAKRHVGEESSAATLAAAQAAAGQLELG